jgi:PKD repeat protein
MASAQVVVTNAPPQAILAGPSSGETGQTLSYDSSRSSDPNGSVVGELWRFGHGSGPVAGAQASHAYPSPGTYQVTLTVRDNEGAPNSATLPVTITASKGSGATTAGTHGVLASIEAKRPTIRIASKLARDRQGHVLVTVLCADGAGPCRGVLTLQLRRHGKLKRLGTAGYAIGPGNTAKVAVSPIKSFAATARFRSLTVNVVATVRGGLTVAASCRLAAPSTKRTPHHK